MSQASTAPANPLTSAALSIPARTAKLTLAGAKLAGIAALLVLFVDQSYDGTRGFTLGAAMLIGLSLAPVRGIPGVLVAAAGAGLLLFAGSTLTFYAAGLVAIGCGLVASAAALVLSAHRETATWTLAALFAGAPLTAMVAVVVIAITQR